MEKKTKYILQGIVISIIFYLIIQFVPTLILCNSQGDLFCFLLLLLPSTIPYLVNSFLHLPTTGIIFIISIFIQYSSLGAFIGWLVYYFRFEKKKKK